MKQTLISMLDSLNKYHRSPEELMPEYVSNRLSKSFNQYDKELQQSIEFLTRKHEKSLVKRMKKLDDKTH